MTCDKLQRRAINFDEHATTCNELRRAARDELQRAGLSYDERLQLTMTFDDLIRPTTTYKDLQGPAMTCNDLR